MVTVMLNPLLDLLGQTLLSTPSPDSMPQLKQLWGNSWKISLACYGLIILFAGMLLMAHGTVQNRYNVKELAPRLVMGFLAGALSMAVMVKAIDWANALSRAVMAGGVEPRPAGEQLRNMIIANALPAAPGQGSSMLFVFMAIFIAGMLVALLVTYVVRVTITIVLIVAAPLALMCHALPQTDGIARWWWRSFGGCLAIQIAQSLTLVTAMRLYLTPDGWGAMLGMPSNQASLTNMIVAMALIYVMYRIPFWIFASIKPGQGNSVVMSMVKSAIAYKTMGLIGGGADAKAGGAGKASRATGAAARSGAGKGKAEPKMAVPRRIVKAPAKSRDPYARIRANKDGQYMFPPGTLAVARTATSPSARRRSQTRATPSPDAPPESGPGPGQLAFPDDWTYPPPPLGQMQLPFGRAAQDVFDRSAGQYMLPFPVQRVPPGSPMPWKPPKQAPPQPEPRGLFRRPDVYKHIHPNRQGEYRLPLKLHPTPPRQIPPPGTTPPQPGADT